ncbi:hypothetical protein, partial [Rhizobium ruizarguesonis]|uniref:hypothetical protein n=1 Tax=Rhizobium ruizarguesonis TaxID=2081791 RepID=UPI0019542CF8
ATTRTRNSIGCGLPMAGLLPWAIESQIHLQRNPESKRLRHALGMKRIMKFPFVATTALRVFSDAQRTLQHFE